MTETSTAEPAVIARAITMHGPWGPVYGPVDLDVQAGGVTVQYTMERLHPPIEL